MVKGLVVLIALAASAQIYFGREPVQACSARPLVLEDSCGGFKPIRLKQKSVDYLALNDLEAIDDLGQHLAHGQAKCGWRK